MPHTQLTPTFSFTDDRIEELRSVAPEALVDGKIDFDVLREALGDYVDDDSVKHFRLNWAGKRQAPRLAVQLSKGTLAPTPIKGVNKEFMDGGSSRLYEKLQTDYDVDRNFVGTVRDDNSVEFYFKFPPVFNVALPRQIGSYNPHWGLGRLSSAGDVTLQYIRETKWVENFADLQWTHEKRKIVCAQKYFAALGLDYRPVTGKTADWWEQAAGTGKLS